MICLRPHNIELGKQVPCGKCLACRKGRVSQWVLRILHEKQYHDDCCFVTLTYKDEHLPEGKNLNPRDMQLFWKRIRKDTGIKIKYYMAGEYGEKNLRPHYHAIIFGLGIKDKDTISDCWRLGFIEIGTVTEASARYVAQYIMDKDECTTMKKFEGVRVKPYQRCSQGLGLSWLIDNQFDILENLDIKVKGKSIGVPRYYLKKLNDLMLIDDELLNAKTLERAEDLDEKLLKYKVPYIERSKYLRELRSQKEEELKFKDNRRKERKNV